MVAAWNSAALSADEQAAFAAGKPLLGGRNVLNRASASEWMTSARANDDDSDFPITNAYDGMTDYTTRPDTGGATGQRMEFTIDASDVDVEIDFIALINLDETFAQTRTVNIEIDTVSDFSGATTILSESLDADRNWFGSFSSGENRWTGSGGTVYVAITFTGGSVGRLTIGEVILGRRYMMQKDPNRQGWDPTHLLSSTARWQSESGKIVQYTMSRGQSILDAVFLLETAAESTERRKWYREILHGTEPFVWMTDTTNDDEFHLMVLNDPEYQNPFIGPIARQWPIDAMEQGPHFLNLELSDF